MTDALLFVRWALLTLGMIYFITESAIFVTVRVWFARVPLGSALIYCAACAGFWIGLWTSYFWPNVAPLDAVQFGVFESGVAGMALGAIWAAYKQGNPAWAAEAPLRGEHDDAEETAEEDHE